MPLPADRIDIGKLTEGDTVLIPAASSSVGLAEIQIANRVGAVPVALTRGKSKRQALLDAGAAHVIVTDECSTLDDYLDGDLTGDERASFVAHLSACAACRRAVRENERIDTLLTEATTALESVPAGLPGRVQHRLTVARRRRAAVVSTALAASVAAVWLFSRPTPPPEDPSPVFVRREANPFALRPAERVRVQFPTGAGMAAVPVPTESPNVTFLWLFPERRLTSGPAAR